MPDSRNGAAGHTDYFDRPPEKLVLDGYRHWTRGTVLRSTAPWTEAQLLYRGLLGDDGGERAIIVLARFVKTLGQCAICPLDVFNAGSRFICRDETLVMGLISGIQNCDEPAVHFCLEKLCCPPLRDRAVMAAGSFALTLKELDYMMLPLPVNVVERIIARAQVDIHDGFVSGTVH
ncbi:MAG: hypothetical protein WBA88_26715 [Pseudaminobacter sp.]